MEQLGSTRSIEITKLAMDGLMQREKAIAANTANVMTPGYQRKVVAFEDQLRNILSEETSKEDIKRRNSAALSYNATSLDIVTKPDAQQMALLNKNSFEAYKPEVIRDFSKYNPETDNNVDIETEMMDMAKAGTQYGILAQLEGKMLSGLGTVIKGGGN
ncbi:MAG: flagellar basal body rod protein FlgB [Candidatus Gastranaerophilales bacterium]|nr:flagellar basal body rod protein FlgB [Candidatus Gastranaerophilales bacterium]